MRRQGRMRRVRERLRRIWDDFWSDPDGFEAYVGRLTSGGIRSACGFRVGSNGYVQSANAVEEFEVPASDLAGFGTK